MSELGRRRREASDKATSADEKSTKTDKGASAASNDDGGAAAAASASATVAPPAAPSAGTAGTKRPAKSIRASDQKRKKLVQRCTSPSHFLMDTELGSVGSGSSLPASSVLSSSTPLPSALSTDPNAPSATKLADSNARIDTFLHTIGTMYYRNHANMGTNGNEVWVPADYDKLEYPTLDLLLSPLRKPNVLDNWCPREIALFEAGICAVGKDFHAIAQLIQSKSCKECVDFYYIWKKSSHYAMWKNFGKPNKKPHANKEEQWKAIREQMANGNQNNTNTSSASSSSKVKKEATDK